MRSKPEQWLQSTFANRFNRYRGANGHVFQGRYKAILLDHEAVGPVCHYIHLNPVRAKLVGARELMDYKESSFHQLWHPAKRWPFLDTLSVLEEAGGLPDTPAGRRSYRDYLSWLAERLNMGTPQSLASRVSAHRLNTKDPDDSWRTLKMLECVDPYCASPFL